MDNKIQSHNAEFDDRILRVVLGTVGIVSIVFGVFLIVAVGVFVLKNFAFC